MNRLIIPLVILIGLILMMSVYVVKEPEQVIVTQFGKPVGDPVLTPGLKFKLPIIQKVHRFEKRFLEWDGDPNQLPTRDKRFIWVNMYARWRITDPLLYFQRLRDERGAQTRLDDILDGERARLDARQLIIRRVRPEHPVRSLIDLEQLGQRAGPGRIPLRKRRGRAAGGHCGEPAGSIFSRRFGGDHGHRSLCGERSA